MSISVRKRGGIWHARGSVIVGAGERITVREFSTGCSSRTDALAVAAAAEARIRQEHLEGDAGRARRLTMAECFAHYLQRPGGVQSWDVQRVADLNAAMGARPLSEAPAAWQDWLRTHARQAPATLARTRNTLQAALRHGAEGEGLTAPKLPAVRQPRATGRAVPFLALAEAEKLLAAYNPAAADVVLVLCDMGLRTQEALRMDWLHVNLRDDEIHIPAEGTKSGAGRTVPMTDRVAARVRAIWLARGRPTRGTVFLSARGEPYADTRGRDGDRQGGNPLAQAHATACRRTGITGFRIHDWRHHWAAWFIMRGGDLFTLCRLGGWSSLAMVQTRYGAVSAQHVRDAVRKRA